MKAKASPKSKYFFRFYTTTFENADFGRFGHLHLRIILVLDGSLEMTIGDEHYEIKHKCDYAPKEMGSNKQRSRAR